MELVDRVGIEPDQLIKRSSLDHSFYPYRTITYASQTVPRFVDLPADKALNVLLARFSNGTAARRRGALFVSTPGISDP